MKALLILLTGLIFSGLCLSAAAETWDFQASAISALEVRNGSGSVDVKGSNALETSVTAQKVKFGDQCKMTVETQGKKLFVEVKQSGMFAEECEVNFQISVPKAISLDLKSASGAIKIEGTQGSLDFSVGSGSVHAKSEITKLDGKTGSGDIFLTGLKSGGVLQVGSGSIKIAFASVPLKGELDIRSGSGGAEITLPKDTKIKTSFRAGSGDLINEAGESPDAQFTILMKTGSGNLHIKKQS